MHDRLQFKPVLILTRDPASSRSPEKKKIKITGTRLPQRIKLKPEPDSLVSLLPLEDWPVCDKKENASKSFMNLMMRRK
jgi:hypothetical protein